MRTAGCHNDDGQLGNDNTGEASAEPSAVAGDHKFVALSAGGAHTCALAAGGAAPCWGGNTFGQLGNDVEGASRRWPRTTSKTP